jgi:hypothetical protein
MSPTSSAASGEVSIQEQVAACMEELQILGTLEKVIAASEVSCLTITFYCTQPSTYYY